MNEFLRRHCQQLILNLLIVLCEHNDHLTISSILMNNKTVQMNYGLVVPTLPILEQNFTKVPEEVDNVSSNAEVSGEDEEGKDNNTVGGES